MRNMNPENAFDFPRLADDLFVIWHSNGIKWPEAARQLSYLTSKKTHVIHGFALFTDAAEWAETFPTGEAALEWLEINANKRGHAYNVTISTVAEMKRSNGYA